MRPCITIVALGLSGILACTPASAVHEVRGSARTSVAPSRNLNANVNENVNVNRNVNVNVNRHVDVDVDVDRNYHPWATAAAITTAAVVTSAVVGSMVR